MKKSIALFVMVVLSSIPNFYSASTTQSTSEHIFGKEGAIIEHNEIVDITDASNVGLSARSNLGFDITDELVLTDNPDNLQPDGFVDEGFYYLTYSLDRYDEEFVVRVIVPVIDPNEPVFNNPYEGGIYSTMLVVDNTKDYDLNNATESFGLTAYDEFQGDVSQDIKLVSNVNKFFPEEPGFEGNSQRRTHDLYVLTYEVTDDYGNVATFELEIVNH